VGKKVRKKLVNDLVNITLHIFLELIKWRKIFGKYV
jgi:hypothetical protein